MCFHNVEKIDSFKTGQRQQDLDHETKQQSVTLIGIIMHEHSYHVFNQKRQAKTIQGNNVHNISKFLLN